MTKRDIEPVRWAIRFLYEFLFSVLAAEFVIVIFFKDAMRLRYAAIIFLMYVISYIARKKCANLFGMLIIHALPVVCLGLFKTGANYMVLYALLTICLADASYMHIKRNMTVAPFTDFPWPTFLFCIIVYIYGYYTNSLGMIKGVFLIPTALVFLYLMGLYTDGLSKYVTSVGNTEGMPLKSIIITNSSIVGAVLFLLLILIIISERLKLDLLIKGIGRGITAVVKIVWSIFSFIFSVIGSMITTGKSNIGTYADDYGEEISGQAGGLADFAETIIAMALLALFIYLLVRAGRYILRIIFVRYRQPDTGDVVVRTPVKKHITREKLKGRHIEKLDTEKRVRRLYKSFVLRHKNNVSLDRYKTSRGIEADMEEHSVLRAHEITELYCGVRYGKIKADSGTLKEMKRLAR